MRLTGIQPLFLTGFSAVSSPFWANPLRPWDQCHTSLAVAHTGSNFAGKITVERLIWASGLESVGSLGSAAKQRHQMIAMTHRGRHAATTTHTALGRFDKPTANYQKVPAPSTGRPKKLRCLTTYPIPSLAAFDICVAHGESVLFNTPQRKNANELAFSWKTPVVRLGRTRRLSERASL